ncbi:LysR family transcriptional regulator [Plastoroseomonas arctica]|uniref:LysR family transcriptional regulator n=1 Tax=Plastoroseomonas arctica TaxID=1509237 RepID=A0AAF1KNA5_9PROT|nr:LysR family transcriptional regulator [Plastoroseomonas arctica]MBR0654313.1 LysR family transcriptional regulator [Plastoroseomonas arctica]
MDRFAAAATFVAVIEAGGFSAAARRLRMPLPTVSRRVSELEAHLRVRLLTRTSRQVSPTEAGQRFYESARRLLDEFAEAERLAAGEYIAPQGELAISAPVAFGRLHMTPVIAEFLVAFPEVDVRLQLGDRVVNLAEEHVDLALRIGALPDSALVAQRIGAVRHVVCASPGYLAAHPAPQTPADLAAHHCVTYTGLQSADEWRFGKEVRARVHSRLAVSMVEAAADAAIAGIGITRLLSYQVADAVRDGRLVVLLRGHEPPPWPVHLVTLGGRLPPQKLRAFLEFAAPRLKPRLVFEDA